MILTFFDSALSFRKWLEENHQKETELIVGFHKVATKKPSLIWSESVDEALCFGWIDGVRKSVDNEDYMIRFTPRNPKSNWSSVNIKKVEDLIKHGEMTPAGFAAFEKRTNSRSAIYSYENWPEKLDEMLVNRFREQISAWKYFLLQAPSYQKQVFTG